MCRNFPTSSIYLHIFKSFYGGINVCPCFTKNGVLKNLSLKARQTTPSTAWLQSKHIGRLCQVLGHSSGEIRNLRYHVHGVGDRERATEHTLFLFFFLHIPSTEKKTPRSVARCRITGLRGTRCAHERPRLGLLGPIPPPPFRQTRFR